MPTEKLYILINVGVLDIIREIIYFNYKVIITDVRFYNKN